MRNQNSPFCTGPGTPSRRRVLKLGALSITGAGITLPPLSAFSGGNPLLTQKPGDDPAVIFLWLPGGPAHIDTFDMKPAAPAEYRGEFRPIPTTVPGLEICELLPLLAAKAHQYSIIRSIHHKFADHGGGHKRFMTGRDPIEPTGFVNDYPAVGSMVHKVLGDPTPGIPGYVLGTDGGRDPIDVFSLGASYLGPSTYPFTFAGDPSKPDFQVRNLNTPPERIGQLRERLGLLGPLSGIAQDRLPPGPEVFNQRALDLVSSEKARGAFDLRREPDRIRERYGNHTYGQRTLLARRLVEAGSRFVTMVLESPNVPGKEWPKDVCYNWDSHAVNCHIFNDSRWRFPMLDQAVSALITDLRERGLDKRVMLVVTGEFGRTPKLETAKDRPGRDHWPQAMSVLVSGGGLRDGIVVGSTNSKGEHPKDRPLSPNDLWATVLSHLGINGRETIFNDHTGRPMPMLPDGDPIRELV